MIPYNSNQTELVYKPTATKYDEIIETSYNFKGQKWLSLNTHNYTCTIKTLLVTFRYPLG